MATAETKPQVSEFLNEPFIDFSRVENKARMEEALKKVAAELGREYPMYIGYSRPSSAATFFRASSMRALFSTREKSMKGSFRNSDTCGFVSAVAMITSPSQCLAPILLRASGTRQGEHSFRIETL